MKKLRVTIVGCGLIAQRRHIPSFLKLRRSATLTAMCDLEVPVAKQVAREFGIPRVYQRFSEMLSQEQPDIVDICTPPETHEGIAIEAMENGSSVLVEKPMAGTASECAKMIKASHNTGAKLSVVHNQKFYRPYLKGMEAVRNGLVGETIAGRVLLLAPEHWYMSRANHWIHKLPGGIFSESGPHAVYLLLPIIGHVKHVTVSARKTLNNPWVTFDTFSVQLVGELATGQIFISHAGLCPAEEVHLIGKGGQVIMDFRNMTLRIDKERSSSRLSVGLSSLKKSRQIASGVASNSLSTLVGRSFLGHDLIIKRFVEALVSNASLPVTPEEGMETVRVMEMILADLQAQRVLATPPAARA